MNKQLKLALLEDNFYLLQELVQKLESNNLGEVIIATQRSDDFFAQMKTKTVDALILDIDLGGDSMSGVDVANHLHDKPVMFITGKTKDYIDQIETLRINSDVPIEFLTKPLNPEKLVKLFVKFEKSIKASKKMETLPIKFVDYYPLEPLKQEDIVYIRSDFKSSTNSKKIQLTTSWDECTVSRKSMDYFFEQGLSKENFIQTSQSFIVNKRYLHDLKITRDNKSFETKINFIAEGKPKTVDIEITEEYWKNRKKQ